MRRLLALLLLLVMALGATARAEEIADPLEVEGMELVAAGIAEMAQGQSGWKQTMMANTTVVSARRGKEYVTVSVTIPTMKSGVVDKDKVGDDPLGYLTKALAPVCDLTDTREFDIRIPIRGSGNNAALNWTGERNLANYSKKIGSMGSSAATSFETTKMKQAVEDYLLPKAADMPKRQPEASPAMADLSGYCNAVAGKLGLTEEQANARLPYLLMLMQLNKISADEGMDSLVLNLRVDNWAQMLADADASARVALTSMMGVPEMSRQEIERVLMAQLDQVWMDTYYSTKTAAKVEVRVDLPGCVQHGVQEADELLAYMGEYSAAVETTIDGLMTYAATLDYYPATEIIDTAILSGASAESGTRVYFVAGEANHGYVCIRKDDATVVTGFIHSGTRLMVTLQPGTYQLYCAYGPTWYGAQYAFGKECFSGVGTLEVPETDGNVRITLEDNGGALHVEPLAYDEFAAVIGQ